MRCVPVVRFALVLMGTALLGAGASINGQGTNAEAASARNEVAASYAKIGQVLYRSSARAARGLQTSVTDLIAEPNAQTLGRARTAWLQARRVYGQTEVFRFNNGPIDNAKTGVENYLNSWPVDESYIDYVVATPKSGIINNPKRWPNVNATSLLLLNERGGETNISVGWHAIEFLLWGEDIDPKGPGNRPFSDFDPAHCPTAERRCAYLRAVTDLLVQQLEEIESQWAPGENSFTNLLRKHPEQTVRRMLLGMVILSGFEMSGERLAVAFETGDQEQEHSCFSDSTTQDFVANQQGVANLYFGDKALGTKLGLRRLVQVTHPKLLTKVDQVIRATTKAIAAIPHPFDQAILAKPGTKARKSIEHAISALENQAEMLSTLGALWNIEVPLRPAGM